jgi:hypothetical protein
VPKLFLTITPEAAPIAGLSAGFSELVRVVRARRESYSNL